MKIGIVTQPLEANFGGLLQNYALQTVLRRMGHHPVTLRAGRARDWRWPYDALVGVVRGRGLLEWPSHREARLAGMRAFVTEHIECSPWRTRLSRRDVERMGIEALCVGSDQTWRPMYNPYMEDMFLRFAEGMDLRRFSYAASFGSSEWEIPGRQTAECARLVRAFRGVSVREESGEDLCRRYLGVPARAVLDPTLLLDGADYEDLCREVPRARPHLFAYILDASREKEAYVRRMAQRMGVPVTLVTVDDGVKAADRPERWLAQIRDAAAVVTDSYHGTIFSLLLQRPFLTFVNASRGNARFESLVRRFDIGRHMVSDASLAPEEAVPAGDTAAVAARIAAGREVSLAFLRDMLE